MSETKAQLSTKQNIYIVFVWNDFLTVSPESSPKNSQIWQTTCALSVNIPNVYYGHMCSSSFELLYIFKKIYILSKF